VGENTYNFGRLMKVFMRIANGKLTVRVGGGYMTIQEFLAQHGETEAMWYEDHMTTAERDADGYAILPAPSSRRGSTGRGLGSPRASTVKNSAAGSPKNSKTQMKF